ncbi:MAG: hypothetical protein M5R42_21535 [Rhodocyclaceae bacterium]|nr:hypothetical protein [Rhodocyclaceae bacterium]
MAQAAGRSQYPVFFGEDARRRAAGDLQAMCGARCGDDGSVGHVREIRAEEEQHAAGDADAGTVERCAHGGSHQLRVGLVGRGQGCCYPIHAPTPQPPSRGRG